MNWLTLGQPRVRLFAPLMRIHTHTRTWLIYMICVWYDWFICAWRDSSICVTWLLNMCDTTHSYVWHDSSIRLTWPHDRTAHIGLQANVGKSSWGNEKQTDDVFVLGNSVFLVYYHSSQSPNVKLVKTWTNSTQNMNQLARSHGELEKSSFWIPLSVVWLARSKASVTAL